MNVQDFRRRIADLSPEQRVLLARRLTTMEMREADNGSIPRRAGPGPCPLSFAQQRLWFLDQLEPHTALYNIPYAVRLRGRLNVDALREALDVLVARHEVLRTTFAVTGGEPHQVVAEHNTAGLAVADLRAVSSSEREAELARRLRAEARRPFVLATDLMIRALLVQLDEQEHVLLLTLHHIAADGWSMGVLTRELRELYAAHIEARAPALPPLAIQYGDYAMWQRARPYGEQLSRQLAYWKARLAGMPPALQLPTDRPRPAVQTHPGARETRMLSRELAAALQALTRRNRATLFMTLLAAFQTLLHRYAGTDDVVVGTPIAGRHRVETEGLIGFFVNTLALRTDLSGDPPFRELLARVRETVVEAYDHQDVPFEKVVEELRPARSLSSTPLVQVMFTLEEGEHRGLELPGLVASSVRVELGTAKFDLTAAVRHDPEGLRVTLAYNTDLYDAESIRRMLGHYETLLAGIVADPARSLSGLPLLTDTERHQLVVGGNATQAPFPQEASIAALFEAQVARSPEAVAVTSEQRSLTYRQLNDRANQLAHFLRRRGVGPEAAVGICLAPSLDLIVGLLAILKAGGMYVPLDPAYPKERLSFMLEDAQVAALVTRQGLAGGLPAVTVPIIALDANPQAAESTDDPPHQTGGDHLAYLMYTSGSTGRPKAVAVPHRGVTRLVMNTDYVKITAADVMAQASNASFDAATFEIWGALLNGARLVVMPREVVLSPTEFGLELERHGITILFLTTALFNQMAREMPAVFRTLRTLLVGGEAAEPRWFEAALRHGAPQRLLNVYGPTETTTFACWYLVENMPAGAAGIPIGRPIRNTQVYVLDGHLTPVPAGVPGELYIGGPGVARGYHRRPDLTAGKFIPDPFGSHPGALLYKTGDRARYRADGNIEFLGRVDEQVKILGHRIEPGEIEAVLRSHPAVREVIVLPREDVPGNKRLVAYVVPALQGAAADGGFRSFLKERLPSYMVPAHVIVLDAMPLTTNGKINRGKLPAPADVQPEKRTGYASPESPLEQQLVQIWEEILDVRPIGALDDFFELGGHSLLAVRAIDAIERATGRRLPLPTLFEGATIRDLARALMRQTWQTSAPAFTAIHPDGARLPFFFLHGDFNGGGFYCRALARALGPEQPFIALHPHGLGGGPVPNAIEAMATDHLAAVRALQPHGPYRLGGHCNGGLIAFEMARRLRAQGERVDLLVLMDAPVPKTGFGVNLIHAFVNCLGSIRRLTAEERLDRVIRLRRYGRRLRELAGLPLDRWVAVLRRRTRRGGETVRKSGAPLHALVMRPPAIDGAGHPRAESVDGVYRRAIACYVPRRYPGAITLFCSGDRKLNSGWRALSAEVEVHAVPGDHYTSITRHVQVVGEHLSACLRRVEPT